MSHAHPPPAARNRNEDFRSFRNERRLLFRRDHQVAITLLLSSESCENPGSHPKVGRTHVRPLFNTLQTQRNAAKISCIQVVKYPCARLIPENVGPVIVARDQPGSR